MATFEVLLRSIMRQGQMVVDCEALRKATSRKADTTRVVYDHGLARTLPKIVRAA